jgi:Major tropism determinant N-terminal domain
MVAQMQQRRGLASEWSTVNPILADGEIGIDKTNKCFKIGDGVTNWNNLKTSYLLKSLFQAKGDIIVGTGPRAAARLARGTTGQTLSIDGSGNLVWVDPIDTASYLDSGAAETLYETIDEAIAVHTAMILSTTMASTYETIAASNATHALFETFVHSAATYALRSTADAAYRKKVLHSALATTPVSINSTVLTYNSNARVFVEANSFYFVEMVIFYASTVAAKMDLALIGPLNSTSYFGVHGPVAAMASGDQFGASHLEVISYVGTSGVTPRIAMGAAGATAPLFATVKGIVQTGANVGFVGFGHSQTTATNDTGAQLYPPSYVRAKKIA